MEQTKNKMNIKVLNFSTLTEQPTYKPDKANGFVKWGEKNDYPDYILNLYNHKGSASHKAIINRKVKMIAGQGFDGLNAADDTLNLKELAKRLATDYEMYNGFAFEIIYDNGGQIIELNHVPIRRIRKGIKSNEINFPHYWYSTDWCQFKKEEHKPQFIREYNPLIKQGKQLFYYTEYVDGADIYPLPSYSTSINWIELDYEISKFHLNQAKNGYAPQFILNFGTGIPTEEEMDESIRAFKREYKGTDGEVMMITFSEGNEQAPTLIPLQLNDSDERFITLSKDIKENIFIGHEVTNPQLFGVRVPGELGGKNELMDALSIFQAIYVDQRQENLEDSINTVLGTTYKLKKFTI